MWESYYVGKHGSTYLDTADYNGHSSNSGDARMYVDVHCIRCRSPLEPILYDDDGTVLVWICGCVAMGSLNDRDRLTARYWDKNGPAAAWLFEKNTEEITA